MSRGAGYTRAELLALRSAPACTRLAREYSEIEHVFASPSSNVLISLYGASSSSSSKPTLNSTAHPTSTSAATVQTYPTTLASHARTLLPLVRHCRGLASLNLYPSCQRDLEVNCMLWECCHVGEYNSSKWDSVLGANIFALAIPSTLAVFLRSVSKAQLLECILEVLALIAEDEDEPGLELMRSELEPSIWNLLEPRITPHRIQRPTALLARVETLLRMCHLSPWKVDVYASYVTPSDMKLVLSHSGSYSHAPSPSAGLVRSRATRPVAASVQITATMPIAPVTRSRAPSKNVVYWKLYLDWLQFREMCVQRLHAHPRLVADAMMNAVAQARTKQVWQIAETVLLCAARPPTKANWLAKLPKDVIANVLIPHVLLAACTAAHGNHDSWSPEIIPATRRARERQRARR